MPKSLKDALVALSLSSLCFISAWQVLLNSGHYSYYFWQHYPGFTELIALGLDVLLLALVFWLGITIVRRTGSKLLMKCASIVFLLIFIIPLNSLRMGKDLTGANLFGQLGKTKLILLGLLALVIAFLIFKFWLRQVTKFAVSLLLILSPFVLIAFSQGVWLAAKHRTNAGLFNPKQPASKLSAEKPSGPHVLWIIFDELDQRVLFDARPEATTVSEFERFRNESLYADNAYPPAGETLQSMPTLITGRLATALPIPVRPDESMMMFEGGQQPEGWSTQPNIFSKARAAGFKTALIGWYQPYCRIIGDDLDVCHWETLVHQANPVPDDLSLFNSMRVWARDTLFRVPLMFRVLEKFYSKEMREYHIGSYLRLMNKAQTIVRDRSINLALIHLPVPHHPFIYDRARDALSPTTDNVYADNLELADRALGELRRSMEADGTWDSTTIVITSDHWWRESNPVNGKRDHRIPFMFKLAGQNEALTYHQPFNTILTQDLLLACLNGELKNHGHVVQWLDQHRSIAESPYTKDLP
ncbi:MAG TPA: sulfatase-like hydrolase/transferase [Pyrinomonadaceae bacterium]|jgi:hypothetical protein